MDWIATWLTLKLAVCTTAILFVIGLPLAYWLAMSRWSGRFLIEAIVALPLVLPPTVLGFYLLVLFAPRSSLGGLYLAATGGTLPFSFTGILIGSVLYNLPFAVRPMIAGFDQLDRNLIEASWCLGETRWSTFWRVSLPLSWPAILTGLVLTFAHCVGEFGIVLMIGGNLPGVTRTLSVAIYDDVQALDYAAAGSTSLVLVIFSLLVLCLTQYFGRRKQAV